MPLKIMLYLSLFSPGKYTSCQEDFKYPHDDFFSFCVFSFFCGGAVEIKKSDMCIYTRLRQACFLVQEQTAWA